MLDIGWSKLLLIAVIALIVIGPKELPAVLRTVGHWMGKARRMAAEFQSQFQEAMREAEMADLKKHADDLNSAVRSLTGPAVDLDAPSTGPSANLPASVAAAPASESKVVLADTAAQDEAVPEREARGPTAGTAKVGERAA